MCQRGPGCLLGRLLPLVVFAVGPSLMARSDSLDLTGAPSIYRTTEHQIGRLTLPINNNGGFGGMASLAGYRNWFTGEPVRDAEYPKLGGQTFIGFGGLWVGAIVGTDTLVSTCASNPACLNTGLEHAAVELFEFQPGQNPDQSLRRRSTLNADSGAVAHEDFVAVYSDTCSDCFPGAQDWMDGRPHRPIGIEVTQRSYAWAYAWSQDLIPVNYTIKNIGANFLSGVYAGIFLDADVLTPTFAPLRYLDDLAGSRWAKQANVSCPVGESTFVAWVADNDGEELACGDPQALPNALGLTLLHAGGGAELRSFNWWVTASNGDDFSPRRRSTAGEPFRNFATGGTGVPYGDINKYYLLRHREFDYDQFLAMTIKTYDSVWSYIPDRALAERVASSGDIRILLSVGPWNLTPGEEATFTVAFVGGENLHTRCQSLNWTPEQPGSFAASLDYTSLDRNTLMAKRIVDWPGVDTDSDGFAGIFTDCLGETTWASGDGVPDFRAAAPPEAPIVWASPMEGSIRVRWNGAPCEATPDRVNGQYDFEEYNVWLRDDSAGAFSAAASWDVDDYVKNIWDDSVAGWLPQPYRLTADSLRCLYAPGGCADTAWRAGDYTLANPYHYPQHPDSIFAFAPVGPNARLGTTAIHKRFPDALRPTYRRPQDVPPDSTDTFLTPAGLLKYYEYEMVVTGLTPGRPYEIAVTAADYGCLGVNEPPQRSSLAATIRRITVVDQHCCVGAAGNIDCDPNDMVDIADLTTLIDNLFISMTSPCCPGEADCDGTPGVDIGDLSALISYLFRSLTPLSNCGSP